MVIVLRSYQQDSVARVRDSYIRGHRAPLLVQPTGAGKTIVLAAITAGAHAKGRRTLFVVHRRELLKQASEKLRAAGVPHGIIAAGFKPAPDELIQLANIQTIAGRLADLGTFALIIFDEAHHTRAPQYAALIAAQPHARLLGVTATPARLDGQGLGVAHGGCFDDLIVGVSAKELIAQGFLSQVRCFMPAERLSLDDVRIRNGDYAADDLARLMDNSTITGDAIDQYRWRADHQPALAFCASIAHAKHVANAFAAAGYRSAHVHGGMKFAKRDALISGLGSGEVEVLTSCDLIAEGLDVPAVGAIILLRPTKSLVLHRQQIGRGMRPADGKSVLVVNDHVSNGLVHGLPEFEPHGPWPGSRSSGVKHLSGAAPNATLSMRSDARNVLSADVRGPCSPCGANYLPRKPANWRNSPVNISHAFAHSRTGPSCTANIRNQNFRRLLLREITVLDGSGAGCVSKSAADEPHNSGHIVRELRGHNEARDRRHPG